MRQHSPFRHIRKNSPLLFSIEEKFAISLDIGILYAIVLDMEPHVRQAIRKALQSPCQHKVSAVSFDHKGDILGFTANTPFINNKGGGIHAERKAMGIWGNRIKTILICRANNSGQLLPIHPCKKCLTYAAKHGIIIRTIEDRQRFEAYEREGKRNPRDKKRCT